VLDPDPADRRVVLPQRFAAAWLVSELRETEGLPGPERRPDTSASLMLAAGVHPKVVQERLASASITLDLYSRVAPGMQDDGAARLGAVVFGSS